MADAVGPIYNLANLNLQCISNLLPKLYEHAERGEQRQRYVQAEPCSIAARTPEQLFHRWTLPLVPTESSDSEKDDENSGPSKMFGVTPASPMVPNRSGHNGALSGRVTSGSTGVGKENGEGVVAALRSDTDLLVLARLEGASLELGGNSPMALCSSRNDV